MWQPTLIRYSFEAFATSTGPVRVVTDAGIGYLKALGNDQGPHALVREYVGTSIARYLGLATLDFALIEISAEDSITLGNGSKAMPGPAFITKELENSISGIVDTSKVINVADFTGIVVADTLLMNRDRFPGLEEGKPRYDNLLFQRVPGEKKKKYRLIAMDFSHCLHFSSTLNNSIDRIGNTKSEELFGIFPEFREYITQVALNPFLARLSLLNESNAQELLSGLPIQWEVDAGLKAHIINFLVQRANFLYDKLEDLLKNELGVCFL